MNDTTKINQHNVVSSNDAITYIESLVNTLIADQSLARKLPPIMLRGAPGVGKSTIVRSIAEKLGIEFIDIRLSQLERVDFCGLPSIEDHTTTWNNINRMI